MRLFPASVADAMRRLLALALLSFLVMNASASAALLDDMEEDPPPPALYDLQNIPKENTGPVENAGLPIDIRTDAQKEAAMSYGARGGLAWRTYHIRQELETRASYMDKVFDFRQLLIPAQSGLMIEPPIIGESLDALKIADGGLEAAVADRVYNIGRNARIVPTARTWRAYLEREWGGVEPPPDILRPANDNERAQWTAWVSEGWDEGIDQANEIFQDDLNKLVADYQGMVRYR